MKNFFKMFRTFLSEGGGKSNLISIIFLIILTEFCCFYFEYSIIYREYNYKPNEIKKRFYDLTNYLKHFYLDNKIHPDNTQFRNPAGLQYLNSKGSFSVVLFGCSFTNGFGLKESEALHSILSKQIKQPVFNLGLGAGSPREMLYILRNNQLLNVLIKNNNQIKYIIYTYISDHNRRLYMDINLSAPHFRSVNNMSSLVYQKNYFYYHTFIYKCFKKIQFRYTSPKLVNELLFLYFKEIDKEIKNRFKSANFIIIVYDDSDNINWEEYERNIDGIKIIKINDILNINLGDLEYKLSETDSHPNAKAWEVVVPAIVKELNL